MIVREVSFKVAAERHSEFVSFWTRRYRAAMSTKAGFVDAQLLARSDSAEDLQMVLTFRTEEDAAAWRASAEHAQLGPKLQEYASGLSVIVFRLLN